jgi:PAC2 family
VDFVEVIDSGPFRRPVTVVALDGWVNAGSAATIAAEALVHDAPIIARFDSDRLYDYRMSRPVVDFVDGVMQQVEWPELTVRLHATGTLDLLVVTGIEPNWSWQQLSNELVKISKAWGVTQHLSIGGVPWAAPHTRPISVMTTASSPERVPANDHPGGLLRVPGAAVSALEWKAARSGIPTSGFWARVPNYVGNNFAAASIALLRRLEAHLGVTLPTEGLAQDAADELEQLDLAVSNRPDVKTMVEQFEQLHDAQVGSVSGEDLASEIEKFLREQQ